MLYFKAPGRCIHQDFVTTDWGEFTRYVEVAVDQYAMRQAEIFHNGNILRYDRSHWCDEFGMLLGVKFSRKAKWTVFFPGAEVIEGVEFEKVWRSALCSELWPQQVNRSRIDRWGMFRVD